MNLWGFGPDAFGPLEEQFRTFLDGHGTEPHSEFFLTNPDGTAEVVLSYGRALAECPEEGVAAELEQSISALAAATFSSLRMD